MELTKKHETHYRGKVSDLFEELEQKWEGSRVKGEVTIVIGPFHDVDEEYQQFLKGSGFDPEKDAMQRVNVLETARQL